MVQIEELSGGDSKAVFDDLFQEAATVLNTLSEIDPVALSQDEEKTAELQAGRQRVLSVLNTLNAVMSKAEALKKLTMIVYFSPEGARHDVLKLFTVSENEAGDTVFGQVRLVTDMVAPGVIALAVASVNDEAAMAPIGSLDDMNRVDDVHIAMPATNDGAAPGIIMFSSGSEYRLSDTYSVRECFSLSRTVMMQLR